MESAAVPNKIEPIWIEPAYLRHLTDDFSIWQHSSGPDIAEEQGYALDDATRALIAASWYGLDDLARTYLGFLRTVFFEHGSTPMNFYTGDRQPINFPASSDALGQSVWAIRQAVEAGYLPADEEDRFLERIDPFLDRRYLRGLAYASIGNWRKYGADLVRLTEKGMKEYADSGWVWPEASLKYANAIFPYALFHGAHEEKNDGLADLAWKLLAFVHRSSVIDEVFSPVGNEGWWEKGGIRALFAQQPIEAGYHVLACELAAKVTGKEEALQWSDMAWRWFWGENLAGTPMVDSGTGRVFDGIDSPTDINRNAGSENIDCFLLAQWARSKRERRERPSV